jgi:SAM-dependent methyltransferase
MNCNDELWASHYIRDKIYKKKCYPEMFITRLLTSSFPVAGLEHRNYREQRLLDLSCGYGRNFGLFNDLGFDIYATEISADLVEELSKKYPDFDVRVGLAHNLPFDDIFFDGVVACNSCYYLAPEASFFDNIKEIHRVIKNGGWFIGSVLASDHSLIKDAIIQPDGSLLIVNDLQGLRNNCRLQSASSKDEVKKLLSPFFNKFKVGYICEDFEGFKRSLFFFSCYRISD